MNKALIVQAILDALREEFETFRDSSKKTRNAGNDAESKAESKYDTLSIEENYLADGFAIQAQAAAQAAAAYENLSLERFDAETPIEQGALVQIQFPDETAWFFLGPAGGGIEVTCEGREITVITPESPLGQRLFEKKIADIPPVAGSKVLAVE